MPVSPVVVITMRRPGHQLSNGELVPRIRVFPVMTCAAPQRFADRYAQHATVARQLSGFEIGWQKECQRMKTSGTLARHIDFPCGAVQIQERNAKRTVRNHIYKEPF